MKWAEEWGTWQGLLAHCAQQQKHFCSDIGYCEGWRWGQVSLRGLELISLESGRGSGVRIHTTFPVLQVQQLWVSRDRHLPESPRDLPLDKCAVTSRRSLSSAWSLRCFHTIRHPSLLCILHLGHSKLGLCQDISALTEDPKQEVKPGAGMGRGSSNVPAHPPAGPQAGPARGSPPCPVLSQWPDASHGQGL